MNCEEANKISIMDFLRDMGIEPVHRTWDGGMYKSPIRSENTASFHVNNYKNKWYDFGMGIGGDFVELAKKYFKLDDITKVLRKIAELEGRAPLKLHKRMEMPPAHRSGFEVLYTKPLRHPALLNYLQNERGIPVDVATTCCEQVYYRVGQKTYFGIGFKNRSGGYEIRSQNFKGCGTCKDVTFIPHGLIDNGQPRHLCLFEGFIDFLSYVTLQVNGDRSLLCAEGLHDIIVLNSVVNIKKIVGMINRYAYIHCYLDNDEAGERGYSYLLKLFGEQRVINESTRYLEYNDVNDFICGKRKKVF